MMRNRMICHSSVAMPHRKEQTVNITMQIRKNCLRPKTRLRNAEMGSTMPLATR
ncbi:hypothetical protein D3C76_1428890 [compost metagenome]